MKKISKIISCILTMIFSFEIISNIESINVANAVTEPESQIEEKQELNDIDRVGLSSYITAPKNLAVKEVTDTEISIEWDKVLSDNVKGYAVYANDELVMTVGDVNNTVLTNLQPNTKYSIYIVATDFGKLYSGKSNVVMQNTKESEQEESLVPLDKLENFMINPETLDNSSIATISNNSGDNSISDISNITSSGSNEVTPDLKLHCNIKTIDSATLEWELTFDLENFKEYEIYSGENLIEKTNAMSYVVGGLEQDKTYTFQIKAIDNEGKVIVESNKLTISTDVDKEAPTVPGNLTILAKTEKSLVLLWEASTDNTELAGYELYNNDVLIGETKSSTTYTLTDIEGGTEFNFKVRSKDTSGNYSEYSEVVNYVFNDALEEEGVPSTPTNLICIGKNATDIYLQWDKVEVGESIIVYDIFKNGEFVGSTNNNSFTLKGLDPTTEYTFSVKAKSLLGKESQCSEEIIVSTEADTQKPTAATNLLIVDEGYGYVKLHWMPSKDNTAVEKYEIYDGDNKIGEALDDTLFLVEKVVGGREYNFSVIAIDKYGNSSDKSDVVTFLGWGDEPEIEDTMPPSVPSNIRYQKYGKNKIFVYWDECEDNIGVVGYDIYLNNIYICTVDTPGVFLPCVPNEEVNLEIVSKDAAGNKSIATETIISNVDDIGTMEENAYEIKVNDTIFSSSSVDRGYEWYNCYKFIPEKNGIYTFVLRRSSSDDSSYLKIIDDSENPIEPSKKRVGRYDGYAVELQAGKTYYAMTGYTYELTLFSQDMVIEKPDIFLVETLDEAQIKLYLKANSIDRYCQYEVYKDDSLYETLAYDTDFSEVYNVIEFGPNFKLKVRVVHISGVVSEFSEEQIVDISESIKNDTEAPILSTSINSSEYLTSYTLSWSRAKDNIAVKNYEIYMDNELYDVCTGVYFDLYKDKISLGIHELKVRAVDYSGNKSQFTDAIKIEFQEITTDDYPNNMTDAIEVEFKNEYTITHENIGISEREYFYFYIPKDGQYYFNYLCSGGYCYLKVNDDPKWYLSMTNPIELKAGDKVLVEVYHPSGGLETTYFYVSEEQILLDKVENLKVEKEGSKCKLTWDKVSYADGYEIYVNDKLYASVPSWYLGYEVPSYATENINIKVRVRSSVWTYGEFSDELKVKFDSVSMLPSEAYIATKFSVTLIGSTAIGITYYGNKGSVYYNVYVNGNKYCRYSNSSSSRTCLITDLEPNTEYEIVIISTDRYGTELARTEAIKVTTREDYNNSQEKAKELKADTIYSGVKYVGDSGAWYKFIPTKSGKYSFYADIYYSNSKIYDENLVSIGVVKNGLIVADLEEGKTYYLVIVNDVSNKSTFRISCRSVDDEPPTVPLDLSCTATTESTITLSWKPSQDAKAVMYYEIYRDGIKVGRVVGSITTFTDRNLDYETIYSYKIVATDEFYNSSDFSNEINIATEDDITPPSTPSIYEYDNSGYEVILSFSSSDKGKIKEYIIYQDDTIIGRTANTKYVCLGLQPNKSYSFKACAVDMKGNVSDFSAVKTITTKDDDHGNSFYTATEIDENQLVNICSNYFKDEDYFTFKVGTDGKYILYSYGDGQICAILYDKDFNYLEGKINNFLESNFNIQYDLIAGEKYYLRVCNYDAYSSFSIRNNKLKIQKYSDIQVKAPSNVEVVNLDNFSFTLNWSESEDSENVIGYAIYKDGKEEKRVNREVLSYSFSGLNPDTEYKIEVRAINAAGKISEDKKEIVGKTTEDITPPNAVNSIGIEAKRWSCNINFNCVKDNYKVSHYEVFLDGVYKTTVFDDGDIDEDISLFNLKPNTIYQLYIVAVDMAGNRSTPYIETFTTLKDDYGDDVENAYEIKENTEIKGTSSGEADYFKYTATKTGKYVFMSRGDATLNGYFYKDTTFLNAYCTNKNYFQIQCDLQEGETYYFSVIDTLSDTTSSSYSLYLVYIEDEKPSKVSNFIVKDFTAGFVELTWKSSKDNTGILEYELYRDGVLIKTLNYDITSYKDSDVIPNTNYKYEIVAVDYSGNKSEVNEVIDVTTLVDVTPPNKVENILPSAKAWNATMSWNEAKDDSKITGYDIYLNEVYIGTTKELTYQLNNLTPDTNYIVKIIAKDLGGYYSEEAVANFKTLEDEFKNSIEEATEVFEEELISGSINYSKNNDNDIDIDIDVMYFTATINGTYNFTFTNSNGSLYFYLYDLNGIQLLCNSVKNGSISYNLISGRKYYIYIKHKDQTYTSDYTLRILPPDRVPPTAPENITVVNSTLKEITLKWDRSTDNREVTEYRLYRNGVLIATLTGNTTSYIDSNLIAGTAYIYTLCANDAAGNLSKTSIPFEASTLYDEELPTSVTNLNVSYSDAWSMRITWTKATDNWEIKQYDVYLNNVKVGSTTENYFTINNLNEDTEYEITVIAIDKALNASDSTIKVVKTMADDYVNSFEDSKEVKELTDVYGKIDYLGDSDYMFFVPERTANYVFIFNNTSKIIANIFDKDKNLLIANEGEKDSSFKIYIRLTKGEKYYISVRQNGDESGDYDLYVTPTDEISPTDPRELKTLDVSYTSTTITWKYSTDNIGVRKYLIYRNNELYASVNGETTIFTDYNLTPDTKYTYFVIARDGMGNVSNMSNSIEVKTLIDDEIPSIPQYIGISSKNGDSVTIEWSNSNDNVAVQYYEIYRDGVLVGTNVFTRFEDKGLKENTEYKYSIIAVDTSNNKSVMSDELSVIPLKPCIIQTTPTYYDVIGGVGYTTINVAIANNQNGLNSKAAFEYSVDELNWITIDDDVAPYSYDTVRIWYQTRWDLTDIPTNFYYLRFTVYDSSNYCDSITELVEVDRTEPNAPKELEAIGLENCIALNWKPSGQANVKYYDIYRSESENTGYKLITRWSNLSQLSYSDKDLEAKKTYYYKVIAIDEFNQKSEDSIIVNAQALEDLTAPTIGVFKCDTGYVIGKTAKFTVEANDNFGVEKIMLQYSIDDGISWNEIATRITNSSAVFYWNTGNIAGKVKVRAVAYDRVGNASTDSIGEEFIVDKTGPGKVTGITTTTYASTIILRWNDVPEEDFSYFLVEMKDSENGTYYQYTKVYRTLGVQITDLDVDTTYWFKVTPYDIYGNKGEESENIVAKTEKDIIAPRIVSLSKAEHGYSDVINLYAGVSDNSGIKEVRFEYSRDLNTWNKLYTYYYSSPINNKIISYDFNVRNIEEGFYYIRVVAIDVVGNESNTSSSASYSQYLVDHTAPSKPLGLTLDNSAGHIQIRWNVNSENDINYYKVYRSVGDESNYKLLASGLQSINYYDRELIAGKTYYYKIAAVDFAGNESVLSDYVYGQLELDTEKPVIVSVNPNTSNTLGNSPKFSVLASDNYMLSNLTVYYELDGRWITIGSKQLSTYSDAVLFDWNTSGLKDDIYRIKVVAEDTQNNESDEYIATYNCIFSEPDRINPTIKSSGWSLEISWDNTIHEGKDVYYNVYRSNTAGKDYELVKSLKENSFTDEPVIPGISYYYKVETVDSYGNTSMSQEIVGIALDEDTFAPVANAGLDMKGIAGIELAFDGRGSKDNKAITSYLWSFGDGSISNEVRPMHTYNTAGEYTVTLTVKDEAGNSDSDTLNVIIYRKKDVSRINVTVLDEETGQVIKDAYVHVDFKDSDYSVVMTNINGKAIAIGDAGNHVVSAYKEGYLPADVSVAVSKFQEAAVTIKLRKSELVVGELKVRRMQLDEIKEAGIDIYAPENQYVYNFEVHLTFQEVKLPVQYLVVNGSGSILSGGSFGFGFDLGNGGGGSCYPYVISSGHPEVPPTFAYLVIPQEVTWLKEFFEVSLILQNMADPQFTIENSTVELFLPEGISLAKTRDTQSLKVDIGSIKGGEVKEYSWIIRGDKKGYYDLTAEFNGTLMPFGANVKRIFKTEEAFRVWGGDALHLYIDAEEAAYIGEDYYVHFTLVNQSDIPVYNVATSFGRFEEPEEKTEIIIINPDGTKEVYDNETLEQLAAEEEAKKKEEAEKDGTSTEKSETNKNEILHSIAIDYYDGSASCLMPGQFIMGTYKTQVPSDKDPDEFYLKLIDSFVVTCDGSNTEIPTTINIIPSHINKKIVQTVDMRSYWADPVDTSTGAFTIEDSYLRLEGKVPLSFDMSYNSVLLNDTKTIINKNSEILNDYQKIYTSATREGIDYVSLANEIFQYKDLGKSSLGNGWSNNFDAKISQNMDGTITVYWNAYSATVFYPKDQNTNSSSNYIIGMIDEDGSIKYRRCISTATEYYSKDSARDGLCVKKLQDGSYVIEKIGQKRYAFDSNGKITSIYDNNGYEISFVRPDNDTLIVKDLITEQELTVVYNSRGLVDYVKDKWGRAVVFEYDNSNNLITVINCNGVMTEYTYDDNGNILTVKTGDAVQGGLVNIKPYCVNTYDEKGRVLSQDDGIDTNLLTYFKYNKDEDGNFIVDIFDRNGNNRQHVYDKLGNLIKIVDELGHSTTMTYDINNNLITQTNALGKTVEYKYDENGNTSEKVDEEGITTFLKYDQRGNLLSIKNLNGEEVTYEYDDNNNLIKVIDQKKLVTTYEYDENGFLLVKKTGDIVTRTVYEKGLLKYSMNDADENVTSYEYDCYGRLIKTGLQNQNSSELEYDLIGNIISEKTPLGGIKQYEYDCYGNKILYVDERGNKTSYEYNGNFKLIKTTNAKNISTYYEYDGEDRLIKVSDVNGDSYIYEYDAAGNLIKEIDKEKNAYLYEYYDNNSLKMKTSPENIIESYTYYDNGKLKTISNGVVDLQTYEYDKVGRVSRIVYNLDNYVEYKYDLCGNKISEINAYGKSKDYTYNQYGLLETVSDYNKNVTKYEYDLSGNVKKIINAKKEATEYFYDINNRVIEEKNARGYSKKFTYNDAGQIDSITDERNSTSYLIYDIMGNLEKCVDAYEKTILTYKYNELNSIESVTDALGYVTYYEYDDLNNLIYKVNNLQKDQEYSYENLINRINNLKPSEEYSYDKNGVLISVIDALGKTSSKKVNGDGAIESITDANENVTTYEYDSLGRLKKEILPFGCIKEYEYNDVNLVVKEINGRNQETIYTYDKLYRLESLTDELGTISYEYDDNSNLLKVTETRDGKVTVIEREYDKLNRVKTYIDANGNRIEYVYDVVGNLSRLVYPDGKIVKYYYDNANNLVSVVDWQNRKTQYFYDKNNRLYKTQRANQTVQEIKYNDKGQVIKILDKDSDGFIILEYNYEYDNEGNIKEEKTSFTSSGNTVESSVMRYEEGNILSYYNDIKIEYDKDGNMIKGVLNGELVDFQYDCRNRLIKAGNIEYKYDAENNRIAIIEDGKETKFIVNPNDSLSKILLKIDSNNEKTRYVYGNGLIGEEVNDEYKVYHYDFRGSTVAITDMDGIITDRYTYGAYGELLIHSGDSSIIFLYNGKNGVVTDSNGLYYMRARYYSSYLKRFINADIVVGSIENGDTLNRYAYVNGNPISFVDPFGLSASLADMGHTLLGCLGMVPIIGNAFDLMNTLWYLGEGDYFNAGLSAMGFLPGPVAAVVGIGYGVYYAKNGDYVNAALLSIPAIPYIAGGTSKLFKMTSGCNNQSRIVDGVLDIGNGSSGFANEYTLPGDMHPSCFVAGTLIVTESGDKPIEEIEIGDKVYSQDVETGEKVYKEVKNVFINEADTIVHLKVNGEEIDTTESHPFWVEEGWVSARDLNIGDIVTLANGEKAEITDVTVEKLDNPVKVYNFEVEDYHTYFVSEVGVLVHNTCLVNTTKEAGNPRNISGVAIGGENLSNPFKSMRGSNGNIGVVPKEVADKLRGREFNSFDDFRNAFWKEYSTSSYASEFSKANIKRMSQGLAPKEPASQQYKSISSYVLHHKNPIYNGGGVYDLDNLIISSPRMHQEILDKGFHFNK